MPEPRTRIIDLAVPLFAGMPQSPNHPEFRHALLRRHGDMVRTDGGSAANDIIVTGTHVGTHVDALAHVSHDGMLHGGVDAHAAQTGGRFREHGVDTIAPFYCRGVLLDVATTHGVEHCPAGYEITVDDLQTAVQQHNVSIEAGSVVLIRSGWGQKFAEGAAYVGKQTGTPGIGEEAARWLAEQDIRAAGTDSIAFERIAPGAGHAVLPVHRVLLVENGIYIFESMALEALSEAGVYEFTFVATPLPIVGATGSPVRPIAIVEASDE